ncbi:MAG: hypothetical protein L0Z62_48695, partial [Gemmataceae bacterium]|nr:hypothetical protein [Gemmataceae bacterium]
LARQCGLGLYLIDLGCERAEALLARGEAQAAEDAAHEAWARACAPDCGTPWGGARAAQLLARASLEQGRAREAWAMLIGVRNTRQGLGDPLLRETEELLARLPKH